MSIQQTDVPGWRSRLNDRLTGTNPLWLLGCGLLALRLALLPAASLAARASALYPLSQAAQPYFQPAHALLLYLAMPLLALGSFAFLLSPGALLLLYFHPRQPDQLRLEEFLVKAFGLSLALLASLHLLLVRPGLLQFSQPAEAAWMVTLLDGLLWLGLWLRARSGVLNWPQVDAASRRRLAIAAGIILLGVILLLPKLFWENFNGDGFEIFDLARSLHQEALPTYHTWWVEPYRVDLRMLLPAYPVFWTMSVIGPVEAAARMPFLFYLALIYLLVLSFSEAGARNEPNQPPDADRNTRKPPRLGLAAELILALQVAAVAVTLGYNASYNPWFADFASPAGLDTLFVLLAIACLSALWRGELAWLVLFGLLAGFTRPSLAYLLLPFTLALVLLRQPGRWKLLAAAVGVLLLGRVVSLVTTTWLSSSPSSGMYALSELLDKYRYLKFDEFQRLAYLIVPGGILPALSMLAWRWQDRLSRALTLTTAFYFLAFYVIAFQALHYYAPVMLLPLVVFWRIVVQHRLPDIQTHNRRMQTVLGGAALLALLALLLSLPRSFQLSNAERQMGISLIARYVITLLSSCPKEWITACWSPSTRRCLTSPIRTPAGVSSSPTCCTTPSLTARRKM